VFALACSATALLCVGVSLRALNRLETRFAEAVFFATYGLIFGIAPLCRSAVSTHEFGAAAETTAAWYALAGLVALLTGFELVRANEAGLVARRNQCLRSLAHPVMQRKLERLYWVAIAITVASQALMMHAKGITISVRPRSRSARDRAARVSARRASAAWRWAGSR